MTRTFDYVVVGAGSAGCVLANRLSDGGRHTVCLLEAGPADKYMWIHVPIGYGKTMFHPVYNWGFHTDPDPNMHNRRLYWPRGRTLGGCSSINGLIYVRGQQQDYDHWAALGNRGWSWRECLPYFRRLEHNTLGEGPTRGTGGPLWASAIRQRHELVDAFVAASNRLGVRTVDDFNTGDQEGVGYYQLTTRNGLRCSTAVAYLKPARGRPNLHVETDAQALKVLFDGAQASGVRYVQHGQVREVRALREVILAAGAVDTPKLLQLSGVGDPALLARQRVPLVHALPAVGRNLQDHLCVSFYFKANRPTLNDEMGTLLGKMKIGLRYLLTKRGPLAMSVNQAGGFFRGTHETAEPNIQLYFNPLSYRIPKSDRASIKPEPYSGFLIAFNPCRPTSRGSIEIASNRAEDAAKIHINALTTRKDLDEAVQGSKVIRALMRAPALKSMTVEEISPGPQVDSDEAMLQYFREQSGSIYHLCGSCAMGPDAATSVVDASLRVHGLQQLRIVDASVFPNITSGNINAPTMMVAEKGADLILADAVRGEMAGVQTHEQEPVSP
ncbi:GMC family oxidoreductase [Burkholderia stabilis]